MIRRVSLAAALVLSAAACAPITAYHGYQIVESDPKDVKVGADTKSSVMERLGSPSVVAAFDADTWYYMTQVNDQVAFLRPTVTRRNVTAISFDKSTQQVATVDVYTLKDGRIISYNGRYTPTRGREMTILEQLLGNVGRQMLPNREVDPGNPRGDGRQ